MGKLYVSFDDTGSLSSPGTGHLLNDFLESLNVKHSFISRHQLFFNPAVPYTSHNSSMCCVIDDEISFESLIALGSIYLEEHQAKGADPGLCVMEEESAVSPELLTLWGYRAKKEVLSKEDAYALADVCHVHLSEHGGTGQGIIGALAAVGLRLAGQDGRVNGKKAVDKPVVTASELLLQTGFQRVCCYGQGELGGDCIINVGNNPIKAVYQNFKSTVLVVPDKDSYKLLTKDYLKCF